MAAIIVVCVGNAGRSQMATALAEWERDQCGLDINIVTGGVDPANSIHDKVVDMLNEDEMDISDREPREITPLQHGLRNLSLFEGFNKATREISEHTYRIS